MTKENPSSRSYNEHRFFKNRLSKRDGWFSIQKPGSRANEIKFSEYFVLNFKWKDSHWLGCVLSHEDTFVIFYKPDILYLFIFF